MTEETDSGQRDIGWKEKLRAALEAGRSLFATRAAIFREELAEKGALVGRGFAGLVLALVFGWLALLLLTAFIAVLLSRLLGSAVLGLAATLLLYGGIAAAAAVTGVKALSRVRPLEFPATRAELSNDWSALKASAVPPAAEAGSGPDTSAEDLEARFRAGSE